MALNLESALDAIYAAPLDGFTKERDRLAKGLAGAGDKSGAARLKGLKKPSISAWVVNQLARQAPEEVAALGLVVDHENVDAPERIDRVRPPRLP